MGVSGRSSEGGELQDRGLRKGQKAGSNGRTMLELQVVGTTVDLHAVNISIFFFSLFFFLTKYFLGPLSRCAPFVHINGGGARR